MASQQQPPARPWFRLASMSRPAAPAPAPAPAAAPPPSAPQPRPAFIRPTFATQPPPPATTSSLPPSPTQNAPPPSSSLPPSPKPIISAPSSSLPPSPVQKPVAPPPPTATISSVPTSPVIKFTPSPKPSPTSTTLPISSSSVSSSPKQIISAPSVPLPTFAAPKPVSPSPAPPPPSPVTTTFISRLASPPPPASSPPPPAKTKIHTPPPSPLTLPSAQLKSDETIEQKTVLVQETFEKPKMVPRTFNGGFQRHGGENHSPGIGLSGKRDVTKDNGYSMKLSDSEELGTRVVTIAGDNKGAIMELSQSPSSNKKKGSPKAWNNGEKSGSATSSGGEEGRVKGKDKNGKKMAASSATPLNTFMNSNVQGVNNSILFNTSCTHHDPGVHISLSRKANGTSGGGIHIKERKNGYNI